MVLVQLPDAYVLIPPASAREVAAVKRQSATEFDRILGAKLRYQITVSGLDDAQVAEQLDIPAFTLRRHIKGEVKVSAEQTVRYASVLGVDPSDLLPRLDSNQQPAGSGIAA